MRKYNTHVTLDQFEEDVANELRQLMKLNKHQARAILQGSEDIVSANWWNGIGIGETCAEIRSKELLESC